MLTYLARGQDSSAAAAASGAAPGRVSGPLLWHAHAVSSLAPPAPPCHVPAHGNHSLCFYFTKSLYTQAPMISVLACLRHLVNSACCTSRAMCLHMVSMPQLSCRGVTHCDTPLLSLWAYHLLNLQAAAAQTTMHAFGLACSQSGLCKGWSQHT